MRVNHGYSSHHGATRYRALGIVVVVHLALGWWLLRGAAPFEQVTRRPRLAPVLIQDVKIASPAAVSVAAPPTPTLTRQRAQAQPNTTAMAPVLTPNPTPALPSTLPVPVPVPAATAATPAGLPASSLAPTPSAASLSTAASGQTRSATPAQPQPDVASGTASTSTPASSKGAAPADIVLVCPTQVAPVMPRLAVRGGITGVVKAQAVIVDGEVRDVRILSGPPVFHNAVRTAMRQYRCASNRVEVLATQEFIFKVD